LAKGGKTLGEGKVTAKPVAKKVVEAELPSKLAGSNGLKPLSPDLPDYSKLAKGDVKAEQARVTAQYEALKSKVKELQAATNASSTEVDTAKQNAAKLKDGVAENARQLKLNQEQAKLCVSMAEAANQAQDAFAKASEARGCALHAHRAAAQAALDQALSKASWEAQESTKLAMKDYEKIGAIQRGKENRRLLSELGEEKEEEDCAYDRQMGEMNYAAMQNAKKRQATHEDKAKQLSAASPASNKAAATATVNLKGLELKAAKLQAQYTLASMLLNMPCGKLSFSEEWNRNVAAWAAGN